MSTAEIVVGCFVVISGSVLLIFILRSHQARISSNSDNILNIFKMIKDYVPEDDYKKYLNGQEKKMSGFLTAKEHEDHKAHCLSEFKHIRTDLDDGKKRFEKIIDDISTIKEVVIRLDERATERRSTDFKK